MFKPQIKQVNIPFKCTYVWPQDSVMEGERESWTGTIQGVMQAGPATLFQFSARGTTMYVHVTPFFGGPIMSIPEYNACMKLTDPSELSYNKERVVNTEHLNRIDGISAVYAFKALAEAGYWKVE